MKRLRRNKKGGMQRGRDRQIEGAARAAEIVAMAEAFISAGTVRFVPKIMDQCSVSRSTVMRALPNEFATFVLAFAHREKSKP